MCSSDLAHLCRPLLGSEDPVQVGLVRKTRGNSSGLHRYHQLKELIPIHVCRILVPILEGDRPEEVEGTYVLASEEVPQQRRRELLQLRRVLDEGRVDLICRTQRLEDVVLPAVDVVV